MVALKFNQKVKLKIPPYGNGVVVGSAVLSTMMEKLIVNRIVVYLFDQPYDLSKDYQTKHILLSSDDLEVLEED